MRNKTKSALGGRKKSFTLVELLVVIAIIGILAAIIIINLSSLTAKGRDAKRRNTMKTLADAFEAVNMKYGDFRPGANNPGMDCESGIDASGTSYTGWIALKNTSDDCSYSYLSNSISDCLIKNGFISSTPLDPKYPADSLEAHKGYVLWSNFGLSLPYKSFCVGTHLENPNENDTQIMNEINTLLAPDQSSYCPGYNKLETELDFIKINSAVCRQL